MGETNPVSTEEDDFQYRDKSTLIEPFRIRGLSIFSHYDTSN